MQDRNRKRIEYIKSEYVRSCTDKRGEIEKHVSLEQNAVKLNVMKCKIYDFCW